jgi:NAD(P)-dependent dehydrogenase (short-subunit alcohol dehydrogenase family)
MNKLRDKVVLITGAGKGSGKLLAQAFAECGAIVAANDISPINVEEVVDRIVAKGGHARAYVEDIAKKVAAQSIVKRVEDDYGRIDILINHAAVQPNVSLLDMDEWDWHRVLDVNLTGAFLMIQSVGRVMRASPPRGAKGSGVIINLITVRQEQAEGEAAFVASMRGLDELTHQAARELSPYGIQVYAVENMSEKIIEIVFALLDLQTEER